MSRFAIMSDTACDLPVALQKKYGIEVISAHLTLPDKSEIDVHIEWEKMNMTREDFYKDLKKQPSAYATAPASPGEVRDALLKHVENGEGVLFISISSAISGCLGFAEQGKALVLEKHPDAEIRMIDSLRFGPALGLMLVHAATRREEGMDLNETAAWLLENRNRFHQAGWLDDLSFVAKKGRVNHAAAFFGSLAGVKPIGEFDSNGLTTVLGKAVGAKAAFKTLMDYMDATQEGIDEQIVFIAETNRLPQAEAFKKLIEERFKPKEVLITDVCPTCGVNVGPGLMAAYYMGKPISSDLSEERAIIEKSLAAK